MHLYHIVKLVFDGSISEHVHLERDTCYTSLCGFRVIEEYGSQKEYVETVDGQAMMHYIAYCTRCIL